MPNQPPVEIPPATAQFTGKTVAELTDYCKNLMADPSGEDDEKSGKKDSESTFTRHPFQIKPRSDTIVMNIRNAVALPVRKPEERVVTLKQQFPVSSGQQHLELEWVPVTPAPVVKEPSGSKVTKTNTVAVAPTPRVSLPPAEPPAADIGSIVAKRISSIRKLQENQFDVQARLELEVVNILIGGPNFIFCNRIFCVAGSGIDDPKLGNVSPYESDDGRTNAGTH